MSKTLLLILSGVVIAVIRKWSWSQVFTFRAQDIQAYANQTPEFDIRDAISGPMQAEGVIFNFSGTVTSRFTARMEGIWNGSSGVLKEDFVYSSDRTQQRQWALTVNADGQITGTAPDIIGEATGQQSGSAVYLKYRIVLPQDAGGHKLDVTDWMYLTDNGTIMNRSEFRKFGIKVAEMVATFRKVD